MSPPPSSPRCPARKADERGREGRGGGGGGPDQGVGQTPSPPQRENSTSVRLGPSSLNIPHVDHYSPIGYQEGLMEKELWLPRCPCWPHRDRADRTCQPGMLEHTGGGGYLKENLPPPSPRGTGSSTCRLVISFMIITRAHSDKIASQHG